MMHSTRWPQTCSLPVSRGWERELERVNGQRCLLCGSLVNAWRSGCWQGGQPLTPSGQATDWPESLPTLQKTLPLVRQTYICSHFKSAQFYSVMCSVSHILADYINNEVSIVALIHCPLGACQNFQVNKTGIWPSPWVTNDCTCTQVKVSFARLVLASSQVVPDSDGQINFVAGSRYLTACFAQPGGASNFLQRVADQKVVLENCLVDDTDMLVTGSVRVANISYHKKVRFLFCFEGWDTVKFIQFILCHRCGGSPSETPTPLWAGPPPPTTKLDFNGNAESALHLSVCSLLTDRCLRW